MKDFFVRLWERIKQPPLWAVVLTFTVTVISAVAAIVIAAVSFEKAPLSIVAYSLFAIAAISLTYSVYLIVKKIPTYKQSVVDYMEKHEFTRRLLHNFGFRTVVLSIISFVASLAFAVFNGYMGIMNRSIWYGALAAYYVFLVLLRGGILTYHNKKRKKDGEGSELVKAKIYRNSGIILLVLNAALSSAIAQMIFSNAHFSYAGWTIFAFAAYSFYKITMSIINLVKAHRQTDYTVKAITNVNLTDAAVSIMALQTALLTTFTDDTVNISAMNTGTGIVVSLLSVGISLTMIITAAKRINALKKETTEDEQQSI